MVDLLAVTSARSRHRVAAHRIVPAKSWRTARGVGRQVLRHLHIGSTVAGSCPSPWSPEHLTFPLTNRDDTVTTQLLNLGGSPLLHHGPPVGRAPDPVPDRYTLPDRRWPDFARKAPVLAEAQ